MKTHEVKYSMVDSYDNTYATIKVDLSLIE